MNTPDSGKLPNMLRDLDENTEARLRQRIHTAIHSGELRALGDEIIALTGCGHEHVLNFKALAQALALSSLPRAAALSRQLNQRHHDLSRHLPPEPDYHGYREALSYSESSEPQAEDT